MPKAAKAAAKKPGAKPKGARNVAQKGERKSFHIFVSDEAHAAWWNLADDSSASLAAIVEAIASDMDKFIGDKDALAAAARKIDTQRRKRKRS